MLCSFNETMATDRTISYMNDILPSSDRCHKSMATDGACFLLEGYISPCSDRFNEPMTTDGA